MQVPHISPGPHRTYTDQARAEYSQAPYDQMCAPDVNNKYYVGSQQPRVCVPNTAKPETYTKAPQPPKNKSPRQHQAGHAWFLRNMTSVTRVRSPVWECIEAFDANSAPSKDGDNNNFHSWVGEEQTHDPHAPQAPSTAESRPTNVGHSNTHDNNEHNVFEADHLDYDYPAEPKHVADDRNSEVEMRPFLSLLPLEYDHNLRLPEDEFFFSNDDGRLYSQANNGDVALSFYEHCMNDKEYDYEESEDDSYGDNDSGYEYEDYEDEEGSDLGSYENGQVFESSNEFEDGIKNVLECNQTAGNLGSWRSTDLSNLSFVHRASLASTTMFQDTNRDIPTSYNFSRLASMFPEPDRNTPFMFIAGGGSQFARSSMYRVADKQLQDGNEEKSVSTKSNDVRKLYGGEEEEKIRHTKLGDGAGRRSSYGSTSAMKKLEMNKGVQCERRKTQRKVISGSLPKIFSQVPSTTNNFWNTQLDLQQGIRTSHGLPTTMGKRIQSQQRKIDLPKNINFKQAPSVEAGTVFYGKMGASRNKESNDLTNTHAIKSLENRAVDHGGRTGEKQLGSITGKKDQVSLPLPGTGTDRPTIPWGAGYALGVLPDISKDYEI